VQGCAGEIDLLPTQINNLPSTQPMSECEQDHERIAPAMAIASCSVDQLFDLGQGEMLPRSQCAIRQPQGDCSIFSGWRSDLG
jgi:hypothetical protein